MKNIMKKITICMMVVILLTACGSDEKALIGTWELEEGNEAGGTLTLSEGGVIEESIDLFDDSYGISWQLSNGKIQFIYYGEVEEEATYKIKGDTLTLKLKNEEATIELKRKE